MKLSQRASGLQIQTVGSMPGWLQFTKEHNSLKIVDRVMVLNLYLTSANALYLYQVSTKHLEGFHSY